MPYHSIESWISKVQAMLERAHEIQSTQRTATALNRELGDDEKTLIQYKKDDIQALARDIANDASPRRYVADVWPGIYKTDSKKKKKDWPLQEIAMSNYAGKKDMEPFND